MGQLQGPRALETAIPNKYKELIGLGVSGATRCRYCVYFHTEAARLFGATEEEINEAALIAKNTMGWSTYLNTRHFDYDLQEGVRPDRRACARRWRSPSRYYAKGGERRAASGPLRHSSRWIAAS
jgi:AhpD family alkylhydroperoxidase